MAHSAFVKKASCFEVQINASPLKPCHCLNWLDTCGLHPGFFFFPVYKAWGHYRDKRITSEQMFFIDSCWNVRRTASGNTVEGGKGEGGGAKRVRERIKREREEGRKKERGERDAIVLYLSYATPNYLPTHVY